MKPIEIAILIWVIGIPILVVVWYMILTKTFKEAWVWITRKVLLKTRSAS